MGNDRAEVLQRIATLANVRGMEATELADIVVVSVRLITDDQGNMTSDVFRAVNEVVDLCHGTRSQNQHAVKTRRRGLELETRAHTGPVVLAGPPVHFNPNAAAHAFLAAAGHAFLTEQGLQLADEGDIKDDGNKDDGSVGSGWGRERAAFGPNPVFWTDGKVRTQRDGNPQ